VDRPGDPGGGLRAGLGSRREQVECLPTGEDAGDPRSRVSRTRPGAAHDPMRNARAGDRCLLCCDELSDPVSDETILERPAQQGNPS
jgi:hypothetical protein